VFVLILMILTTVPVLAADVRSGGTINIAADEVIDEDVYIAGSNITINGTINGDLVAAGGTITVNGTIDGSVLAACGTFNLNGKVNSSVRCATGAINIDGEIGKDLVVAAGDLNMADSAIVEGDILLGANTATISGTVMGDIDAAVSRLTLSSSANITGYLSYTSDNEVNKESGAQIGGEVTHKLPPRSNPFITWIITFLMALVTGIVIILIFPRRTTAITDSIRTRPWSSLGWGALILFLTPVAIMILLITVVGIPLGLIALLLYGAAIYLSQIPIALFIGRWTIGYLREVRGRALLVAAFATGLLVLTLLTLIPYVGFAIWVATALFGLGGLVISIKEKSLPLAGGQR
jgi:cytoskeletal protein CcmA (bactofilin family)